MVISKPPFNQSVYHAFSSLQSAIYFSWLWVGSNSVKEIEKSFIGHFIDLFGSKESFELIVRSVGIVVVFMFFFQ